MTWYAVIQSTLFCHEGVVFRHSERSEASQASASNLRLNWRTSRLERFETWLVLLRLRFFGPTDRASESFMVASNTEKDENAPPRMLRQQELIEGEGV